MRLIPFNTNSFTDDTHFLVDDQDFDKVSKFKWRLSKNTERRKKSRYTVLRTALKHEKDAGAPNSVILTKFIFDMHLSYSKVGEEIDHINRNTLDNRRSNLRICSRHVNQRNKSNNSNMGFGLWGATYNKNLKHNKKWQANFHIKGKTHMVGYFLTELEAHNEALKRFEETTGDKPQHLK